MKKIVSHPLPKSITYTDLVDALDRNQIAESVYDYYSLNIISLLKSINLVLKGEYTKSGWSKTSAFTAGRHTHFWKNPDRINQEGQQTKINSRWLLNIVSGWYVNERYDIGDVIETKNKLINLLKKTHPSNSL